VCETESERKNFFAIVFWCMCVEDGNDQLYMYFDFLRFQIIHCLCSLKYYFLVCSHLIFAFLSNHQFVCVRERESVCVCVCVCLCLCVYVCM